MKRSDVVRLTVVTSMATMLVSCNEKPTRYCVDEDSAVVDDKKCEHTDVNPTFVSLYHWYYIRGQNSAGIGTHLTGGSTEVPQQGFAIPTTRGVIGEAGEEAAGGHGGEGGEGAGE